MYVVVGDSVVNLIVVNNFVFWLDNQFVVVFCGGGLCLKFFNYLFIV